MAKENQIVVWDCGCIISQVRVGKVRDDEIVPCPAHDPALERRRPQEWADLEPGVVD